MEPSRVTFVEMSRMAGREPVATTMTESTGRVQPICAFARRILDGRPAIPRGAFAVARNARVGLATPQTHETISPDAGSQRDNRTPGSTLDELPSRNGRAQFPAEPAAGAPAITPHPAAFSRITLEALLYGVILVAAALTRFWDLGSRALHHDESLHAYFSWLLATGQGYVHDPLMHGPFLFHVTALIFALFGDSDASSRFSPALFGVILVALPILLRGPRHLGRWGALTASALLLISPSILYQSRYLRHDIFTLVGALFLLIAIVLYVEQPSRGWLIAIGATVGFLFTNHEIVFGIVAIFVAVMPGHSCGAICGRWRRPPRRRHRTPSPWSPSYRM